MLPVAADREAMAVKNLDEHIHPSTVQEAEQGSIQLAGGQLAVPHRLLQRPADLCRRGFPRLAGRISPRALPNALIPPLPSSS